MNISVSPVPGMFSFPLYVDSKTLNDVVPTAIILFRAFLASLIAMAVDSGRINFSECIL